MILFVKTLLYYESLNFIPSSGCERSDDVSGGCVVSSLVLLYILSILPGNDLCWVHCPPGRSIWRGF